MDDGLSHWETVEREREREREGGGTAAARGFQIGLGQKREKEIYIKYVLHFISNETMSFLSKFKRHRFPYFGLLSIRLIDKKHLYRLFN